MPIDRFEPGQRVRVSDAGGEFDGRTGTVTRPGNRAPHLWAWVALDAWPDGAERAHPENDPDGRGNWAFVFAEECEPEDAAAAA